MQTDPASQCHLCPEIPSQASGSFPAVFRDAGKTVFHNMTENAVNGVLSPSLCESDK